MKKILKPRRPEKSSTWLARQARLDPRPPPPGQEGPRLELANHNCDRNGDYFTIRFSVPVKDSETKRINGGVLVSFFLNDSRPMVSGCFLPDGLDQETVIAFARVCLDKLIGLTDTDS